MHILEWIRYHLPEPRDYSMGVNTMSYAFTLQKWYCGLGLHMDEIYTLRDKLQEHWH